MRRRAAPRRTFFHLAACAAWATLALPEATRGADDLLAEANRLYRSAADEEGEKRRSLYLEAARRYAELARSVPNGHVLYNLGNAFYRAGVFGRAIAAYRRAEELMPRHPATRTNLALARERAPGGGNAPRPHPAAAAFFFWHYAMSAAEVEALAAVFYVGALVALAGAQFARGRFGAFRPRLRTAAAVLGALALAFALSACAKLVWSSRDSAIVVAAETRARSEPAGRAPELFALREGAELRVISRAGDWTRIDAGRDMRGWVESRALEFLAEPPAAGAF